MKEIKIKDKLYHPFSMDIIEFEVTGISTFTNKDSTITTYRAKAVHNVGACGRVEVLLNIDIHNNIKFYDLKEDYEYSRGLQDFIEGHYYLDKTKARLEFYRIQQLNCTIDLDHKKRLYEATKSKLDTVNRIIKEVTEELSTN